MAGIACSYSYCARAAAWRFVHLNNVNHPDIVGRGNDVLELGEHGPDEASMICLQAHCAWFAFTGCLA